MKLQKNISSIAKSGLIIDQNFARLLRVSNDVYTYEFKFTIDTKKLPKDASTSVKLNIRRSSKHLNDSLSTLHSNDLSPDNVLKSILTISSNRKDAIVSDNDEVDTTSIVGIGVNDPKVGVGKTIKRIVPREIKRGDKTPIMSTTIDKSQFDKIPVINLRSKMLSLLSKGIDPIDVIGSTIDTTTTKSAFAGTSTKHVPIKNVKQKELMISHAVISSNLNLQDSSNIDAKIHIPVVDVDTRRFLEFKKVVNIDVDTFGDVDNFNVQFSLLSSNGVTLASTIRTVKHGLLLTTFNTPREPPIAHAAPVQRPGKNVVELKQVDRIATSIRMYRRIMTNISNVNDSDTMKYVHIGEIMLKSSDGMIKVVDRVNNSSTCAYRFVPVGPGGEFGATFTSVVIPGTRIGVRRRRRQNVSASIDVNTEGDSARVSITNVTPGPIAVAIQRRNVTAHQSDFTFLKVENPVVLISGDDKLDFLDTDLKPGSIYEYRCLLYLECGSIVDSTAYYMYEHPTRSDTGVDIVTTEPIIERTVIDDVARRTSYDVTFSIVSDIGESDLQRVKQALSQQGIIDLYGNELLNDREELSKLIVHSVKRYNTSTGELEDFGIISTQNFSDTTVSRSRAVKPLKPGTTYRYIISTLLRSAETMFKSYVRKKRSPTRLTGTKAHPSNLTTQEYIQNPAKFLHPLTLKTGTITSVNSRRLRHGRDEFAYGVVGNTKVVEVSIPTEITTVSNIRVQHLDDTTNIVKWDVTGDITNIDSFVVVSKQLGAERVVGRVHALSNTSTFTFIHDLREHDVGTISYKIIMISTTYDIDSTTSSNEVVIR